jgi:hypothetical protein
MTDTSSRPRAIARALPQDHRQPALPPMSRAHLLVAWMYGFACLAAATMLAPPF